MPPPGQDDLHPGMDEAHILIANFAHPLTQVQKARVVELLGTLADHIVVIDVPVHFDVTKPLAPQVTALVEQAEVPWSSARLVVNPPGYAPAAAILLATLHGRIGHFPAILHVGRVDKSLLPEFEVAEVINLDGVRNDARKRSSYNEQSTRENGESRGPERLSR